MCKFSFDWTYTSTTQHHISETPGFVGRGVRAVGVKGTGNGEQGTGNREQGTGNGEQGTGNRKRGTEDDEGL